MLDFFQIRTFQELLVGFISNIQMKAIINRLEKFGTIDGVITKNDDIRKLIHQHLKKGSASLIVDTEETLMYELKQESIKQN